MNSAAENNLSKEIISAKSRVYRFLVVIEKNKDGCFAFTPELQGSPEIQEPGFGGFVILGGAAPAVVDRELLKVGQNGDSNIVRPGVTPIW